jgi:hypothetical protein
MPLAASGTFSGTGSEVTQSKATGSVTFTSTNTFFDVPIPDGTTLATKDGVQFATTVAVVLSKASINKPSTIDVAVRAASPGASGNVGADTITEAPKSITDLLVTVTNPAPTTGGKRSETKMVTRDDYNAAVTALTAQLQSDLAAALTDPATTPRGLTLFPQTATLGRLSATAAAGDVVGTKVDTFDLGLDTTATALAVDEALVASVAGDQLEASAPVGVRVFPETITTRLSPGVVQDKLIAYQVVAQARQYAPVDAAKLEESIRGKTLSEARSILEPFGTVVLTVWPDFIPTIPDDTRRINLTVENPAIPR